MTAYPFPAASPAQPAASSADPTAVMGRRIGAIVVDFLLFVLIMSFVGPTPLSPLAEYYEVPDGVGDVCGDVRDIDDDVVGCIQLGDRVYVTSGGDFAVQALVWVAVLGLYAALQGASGFTPGKALFGVKAVDEQGGKPGFGRSLGRTLLWVVDAAPWCLPLVGFITGLTTTGHRRVGDMAVKSFVVGKAHTGPVIVPGLTTGSGVPYGAPGAPGTPWGSPPGASGPPTWGAPAQPQAPWGGPTSGGFPPPGGATPPGTPTGPPSSGARPAPPAGAPSATPSGPPTGAADAPGAAPSGATAAAPSAPADTARDQPSRPAPPTDATTAGTGSPTGGPAPGNAPTAAAAPGGPDAPRADQASSAPAGGPSEPPASATPTPQSPPAAAPTPAASGQPGSSGYNPQWDAARGTYIVWEPQRAQWLGWDERSRQWRPL